MTNEQEKSKELIQLNESLKNEIEVHQAHASELEVQYKKTSVKNFEEMSALQAKLKDFQDKYQDHCTVGYGLFFYQIYTTTFT